MADLEVQYGKIEAQAQPDFPWVWLAVKQGPLLEARHFFEAVVEYCLFCNTFHKFSVPLSCDKCNVHTSTYRGLLDLDL